MSVRERLKQFVKTQSISVSAFEKKVGVYNGFVNTIVKTIDNEKLNKILAIYPNLNKNWLLFGEGEMLLDQPTNFNNNVINITKNSGGNNAIGNNNKIGGACDSELIKTQAETIKQQQNTIEKLTEMLLNLTKK